MSKRAHGTKMGSPLSLTIWKSFREKLVTMYIVSRLIDGWVLPSGSGSCRLGRGLINMVRTDPPLPLTSLQLLPHSGLGSNEFPAPKHPKSSFFSSHPCFHRRV